MFYGYGLIIKEKQHSKIFIITYTTVPKITRRHLLFVSFKAPNIKKKIELLPH